MTNYKTKPIYKKLSFVIFGICFEAHNKIGRFGREKQYGNLIEQLLKEKEIPYKREVRVASSANTLDFIIEDKIILELKTVRFLTKNDYYQIQRYLQATKLKLGILVNFSQKYLRPKRVVNFDLTKKTN